MQRHLDGPHQGILFSKTDLNSRGKIAERLREALGPHHHRFGPYSEAEIVSHVISKIRVEVATRDFHILDIVPYHGRQRYSLSADRVGDWVERRLVRDSTTFSFDEAELLKLILFSMAMPYKMADRQSHATTTELVRRTKRRDFLQILSDQFIGRIGEVAFKRFAEQRFKARVNLDWTIGTDLSDFESDIVGSAKRVDVKSTDTPESIWAVAPSGADYGILVKVCIPHDFFLKVLAHISSLKKFLTFMREQLGSEVDKDTMNLVDHIERQAFAEELMVKAFVCGFFRTTDFEITPAGVSLPYLGEVAEDKYLVPFEKLKHEDADWKAFFTDCGLL